VDGAGDVVNDLTRQVFHFVERRLVNGRQASFVAFETCRHGVESTTQSVGALTRQRQTLDDVFERFVDARIALKKLFKIISRIQARPVPLIGSKQYNQPNRSIKKLD